MTARMKASGAALEHAHATLKDASAAIDQTLRDLDDKVVALRAAWSGEASDAYDQAQRDCMVQLDAMKEAVREYGRRVHEVETRYRAAASTIETKIWR